MADGPRDLCESLCGAAFEALPDAVCIVEPTDKKADGQRDWRYLSCNLALRRMLDIDDMVGQTLRQLFPEQADHWSREFEQVLDSGETAKLVHSRSHRTQVFETVLVPIAVGDRQAIMVRIRDITDEHLERARGREADARYAQLFNAIDEGFGVLEIIFDESGRGTDYLVLEANDAFTEHSGLRDPVGKRMRSMQPDIEDHWSEIYGRIALSGVAERFDSEFVAMGRWFDVFAFPIGEKAPFLIGVLFEDIGERKSMELALKHSENRLHSLIEATSDLIFRINPEGTLVELVGGNSGFENTGAQSNWIEGFVSESDRDAVEAAFAEAIHRRAPLEIEHRARAFNGNVRWFSSRAVPVLAEDGEIAEWFGTATDITQRRQFEQQLAHGTQMLRMASEIGKVGLWDWNVETGELAWSDEQFRMQGFKVGEVVPTYEIWAESIHPDDRADAETKIGRARETGDEYVNEYRVRHRGGAVHWLSARGRFLYDEKGQAVRMLGAMVDTTQRRREEEWQKLLVAELQHRVRNLIGMIRSVARLSASSHRNVDDYVDHLIGRLQAMGRTQSTLTRTPGRKVDLAELVREELLVHAAGPEKCHVDGPEVALSPHAAEIITLAIHELATNSIKYGALGDTGHIRIVWTTSEKNGKPWISLRWQETAPPSKTKQRRRGFGRRLIEERVPYELQGEGRFHLHDTGLLVQMDFPLSDAGSILETGS